MSTFQYPQFKFQEQNKELSKSKIWTLAIFDTSPEDL